MGRHGPGGHKVSPESRLGAQIRGQIFVSKTRHFFYKAPSAPGLRQGRVVRASRLGWFAPSLALLSEIVPGVAKHHHVAML